jgi:hypothetical protein
MEPEIERHNETDIIERIKKAIFRSKAVSQL